MSVYFHEAILNLAAHPLLWGLARLTRRIKPVCKVPGLGIVVSDAAFAREVLVRDKDFAKNGPGSFAQALTTGLGPMALGNMDGEEHRNLRAALVDVTSPERSQALVRNRTEEITTMCSELRSGGVVDIAHFMRGWSGQIAFDLVGIGAPKGAEAEACQDIVRLSARMATVLGFRRPSARQARNALKDRDRMAAYFRAGYEDTAAPDSLAGRLQSLGLNFEQALGVLLIFIIGGTLTTSAALPRLLALFLDHGVFEHALEDQSIMPRFVDEGLRLTAPLPGTVRIATRDVSVGQRRISAGSRIVILTCNMARDPNLYEKPDRFDHDRIHDAGTGRLWFGAGPHRCAGFHLAQRELTTVLTHIAAMQRGIRIESRRVSFASLLPAYRQLRISARGPQDQ